MSTESSHDILTSLPDRPLTIQESRALAESVPPHTTLTPLSIMGESGRERCYVIAFVSSRTSKAHIVGYSPKLEGWEKIESWHEREWTIEKQDQAVQDWYQSTFDETEIDHKFVKV